MVILIVCYAAGGVITFLLLAIIHARGKSGRDMDSVSALVAAVAWPFALTALICCIVLWWLFDALELLFFTVSTYFRGDK